MKISTPHFLVQCIAKHEVCSLFAVPDFGTTFTLGSGARLWLTTAWYFAIILAEGVGPSTGHPKSA